MTDQIETMIAMTGTMHEPVYTKRFTVRSYEVDFRGRVRATAILNYLQEAAGDHSRLLGVAVRDLLPLGFTWVISRMHLTLSGSVTSREELQVRTWPSVRGSRFTCREFALFTADETCIGVATMSFAVLDIKTRRPVSISTLLPAYPLLERRAIDDNFAPLPALDSYDTAFPFRVGRADLDINNHVNNVVYVGWALETVPIDIANNNRLLDLEIAYRAEALYGENIVAKSTVIADAAGITCLHQISRAEDGAEHARVLTRWGTLD